MNQAAKLGTAAVILVTLGVAGWQVERARSLKSSILSGVFESRPAVLSTRVQGRVVSLLVQEGDSAKSGQTLIMLNSDAAESAKAAAEAARRQAEAKLQELLAGFTKEQVEAQAALSREAEAQRDKVFSGARQEEIREARARLAGAHAKLKLLKQGPRTEELARAQAALDQARSRLSIVKRGPSPEEVSQLAARMRAAQAREELARKDLDRAVRLEAMGAIAKSALDSQRTVFDTSKAESEAARLAHQRAAAGSPPEEVREAEANVRQAEAALGLLRAGATAEEISFSESEAERAQATLDLLLKGSREEDRRAAAARMSAASAKLRELQKGSRSEQIEQARAVLMSAEARLKEAKSLYRDISVKAEEEGVVESLMVSVGDLVQPGQALVTFSRPHDLWMKVYLPALRLAQVKIGDSAILAVDGIETPMEAKVTAIATQGEFTPSALQSPEDRGDQAFAITLRLKNPDSRIKPGMSATVKKVGAWP